VNHKNIIGPNAFPTTSVPNRWTMNNTKIITKVIMTMMFWSFPKRSKNCGIPRNPSIAVVTVTAGVSTPSANNAAPPIIAGMIRYLPPFLTKVYKEKIPPSPWLSAFNAITTYLIVVNNVKVQKIKETAPITKSGLIPRKPPLSSTIAFIT